MIKSNLLYYLKVSVYFVLFFLRMWAKRFHLIFRPSDKIYYVDLQFILLRKNEDTVTILVGLFIRYGIYTNSIMYY